MWLHVTKCPQYNWYLNHFLLSIDKHLIFETFENKSIRLKTEKLYNKRTHETSNCLFQKPLKNKVNISDVEKEEESVRKKS